MKKIILLCLLVSFSSFAGEIVELESSFGFTSCVKTGDKSTLCRVQSPKIEALRIELGSSPYSNFPTGKHIFKEERNGFSFEGFVEVVKVYDVYHVQAWISSTSIYPNRGEKFDYLGNIKVLDLADLNRVNLRGMSYFDGHTTLTPEIYIGPLL